MQAPGHRNSLIFENRDIDLKIINKNHIHFVKQLYKQKTHI